MSEVANPNDVTRTIAAAQSLRLREQIGIEFKWLL